MGGGRSQEEEDREEKLALPVSQQIQADERNLKLSFHQKADLAKHHLGVGKLLQTDNSSNLVFDMKRISGGDQ